MIKIKGLKDLFELGTMISSVAIFFLMLATTFFNSSFPFFMKADSEMLWASTIMYLFVVMWAPNRTVRTTTGQARLNIIPFLIVFIFFPLWYYFLVGEQVYAKIFVLLPILLMGLKVIYINLKEKITKAEVEAQKPYWFAKGFGLLAWLACLAIWALIETMGYSLLKESGLLQMAFSLLLSFWYLALAYQSYMMLSPAGGKITLDEMMDERPKLGSD
ncbi:MAG: hypothetical protein ABIG96_04955 [Candidatus Micrarchaeota archaeon]